MSTRPLTVVTTALCLAVGAAMWFSATTAPSRPLGEDEVVVGRDPEFRSPIVRSLTTSTWGPSAVTIAACRMPPIFPPEFDATMPDFNELAQR